MQQLQDLSRGAPEVVLDEARSLIKFTEEVPGMRTYTTVCNLNVNFYFLITNGTI